MDHRAVNKAHRRLQTARSALEQLARTRSAAQFEEQWYVFLTAVKNIYTLLETGAKGSPQSRQWFGGKNKERREDPLLQYLYEARNDEEHGLGSSLEITPEKHLLGANVPGSSNRIMVNGPGMTDVTFQNFVEGALLFKGAPPHSGLTFTPLDHKPVAHRYHPSEAILVPVTGRGPVTYDPPSEHLGKPLTDKSPLSVAKLALSYLEELVDSAAKRS